MNIVGRLIESKRLAIINEEEETTKETSELVGKLFKVNKDIPVNDDDDQSVEKDHYLFVKEGEDGDLHIEVRDSENQIVGMMSTTEEVFNKLVDDSIEEVDEEEVKEELEAANREEDKNTINSNVIKAVADAIADSDYNTASKELTKVDSDEDLFGAIAKAVSEVKGVDHEEAAEDVEDFLDNIVEDEEEDLTENSKVVVRNGKVKRVKKKRGRKKRQTPKQRTALAKARRKSNTSGASRKRKKSMKVRKRRIGESLDMLNEVADTIESYGLDVIDTNLNTTHESLEFELTLDNTDTFEVDLDEMEAHFSDKFESKVIIPDEDIKDQGSTAILKMQVL